MSPDMHEALRTAVRTDRHFHEKNGNDLNPFSTPGYRRDWQKGFDGVDAEKHTHCRQWWRGHYARQLQQESA